MSSMYVLLWWGAPYYTVPWLSLLGLPFGALAGLLPDLLPYERTRPRTELTLLLTIIPWTLLCLYQAGKALIAEYLWQRVLITAVASGIGYLFNAQPHKVGASLVKKTYAEPAYVTCVSLSLWRVLFPVLPWVGGYLVTSRLGYDMFRAGFLAIWQK